MREGGRDLLILLLLIGDKYTGHIAVAGIKWALPLPASAMDGQFVLLKMSIFDQNVKNSATFWEHYFFFNWSRYFSHHEFKITTYFWVLEASFKELIIFSSEICKKYSNYGWIYWYNACRLIAVCRQQFKNTAICPV